MFEALRSIRKSLIDSFKEGVLWRETVDTRTDESMEAAAAASVDGRFLPDNAHIDDDPIIAALKRISTPLIAETIGGAVQEIQRVRKLASEQNLAATSLEDVVAVQRAEINNLMVKLDTAQRDISALQKVSTERTEELDSSATYDIALKALYNSRVREAELRNLASGVISAFQTTSYRPIAMLDEQTKEAIKENIAKIVMEAVEGTGSWAITSDKEKWQRAATAVLEMIEISGVSLPEVFDPETISKITTNIFQAFCLHYGLDPNPSIATMSALTEGQIEIYDRLRNVSRLAANALLGKHFSDKVITPSPNEVNIFTALETKRG